MNTCEHEFENANCTNCANGLPVLMHECLKTKGMLEEGTIAEPEKDTLAELIEHERMIERFFRNSIVLATMENPILLISEDMVKKFEDIAERHKKIIEELEKEYENQI